MDYINKIIKGNTLNILKEIKSSIFDIGVTSPPYNKQEKHKGWLVKNVVYDGYSDKVPEHDYQNQQIAVLNELYRIAKPGASFFYNHKIRWERGDLLHPYEWLSKTKWIIRQEIIWDRKIAANIRGWRFWQVDERIYWLVKPINGNKIGKELESKHALLSSIWRISPEKNIDHPAPFPLELPARCIISILDNKKGVVLDPYCGSGTTLVAAKLLGYKYIGIDISPKYIFQARKRLKNAENERIKIDLELEKHKVNNTFKKRKDEGKWLGKNNSVVLFENEIQNLRITELPFSKGLEKFD